MTAPSQFAYDEAVRVWREAPSRANTSNNDPAASEEASDEPAGASALTSPVTTVNVRVPSRPALPLRFCSMSPKITGRVRPSPGRSTGSKHCSLSSGTPDRDVEHEVIAGTATISTWIHLMDPEIGAA